MIHVERSGEAPRLDGEHDVLGQPVGDVLLLQRRPALEESAQVGVQLLALGAYGYSQLSGALVPGAVDLDGIPQRRLVAVFQRRPARDRSRRGLLRQEKPRTDCAAYRGGNALEPHLRGHAAYSFSKELVDHRRPAQPGIRRQPVHRLDHVVGQHQAVNTLFRYSHLRMTFDRQPGGFLFLPGNIAGDLHILLSVHDYIIHPD